MLKDKIQKDIISAMKSSDRQRLETLRYLMSQIKDEEVNSRNINLTDEQIIKVLSSHLKKLKDSLQAFQKAGRSDLIDKTKIEIEIASLYLPTQISDEELNKEVQKIIDANKNITTPGALIGICIKAMVGKADGGRVAEIIKQNSKFQAPNNK